MKTPNKFRESAFQWVVYGLIMLVVLLGACFRKSFLGDDLKDTSKDGWGYSMLNITFEGYPSSVINAFTNIDSESGVLIEMHLSDTNRIFLPVAGPSLLTVSNDEDEDEVIFFDEDEDANIYFYEPSHGTQLDLKFEPNLVYANGTIRTIYIEDDLGFLERLSSFQKNDLKDLNLICIDDSIPQAYSPVLHKIAKAHPGVSILSEGYESTSIEEQLLQIIRPRLLFVYTDKSYPDSIDVTDLETLILIEEDEGGIHPSVVNLLAQATGAKQLILSMEEFNSQKLSHFEKYQNVKNLFFDYHSDMEEIPFDWFLSFPELESLFLGEVPAGFQLSQCPKLKWLSMPSFEIEKAKGLTYLHVIEEDSLSPQELELIVDQNPDLRYLNLCNLKLATLSPLVKLKKLEGLGLNIHTDLGPIKDMKKLRYLAVKHELYDDEIKRKELSRLCPDCLIVRGGLCLGSGWLLLCFPFILLAVFFFSKKW